MTEREIIERLKMRARMIDTLIRAGRVNSEQLKEYSRVLEELRLLNVSPFE